MKRKLLLSVCALSLLGAVAVADEAIFPTLPHAAFNYIPFANVNGTMHQVFDRALFAGAGMPVRIEALGFAPNNGLAGQTLNTPLSINLGLTDRVPGQSAPTGLDVPVAGGGGAPNALGAVSTFYNNPAYSYTVVSGGAANFEMVVVGTPFVFDPAQGHNLLVEINANGPPSFFSVSRAAGSAESSRSYVGGTYTGASPTTATRMLFRYTPIPEPASLVLLGLAGLLIRRR